MPRRHYRAKQDRDGTPKQGKDKKNNETMMERYMKQKIVEKRSCFGRLAERCRQSPRVTRCVAYQRRTLEIVGRCLYGTASLTKVLADASFPWIARRCYFELWVVALGMHLVQLCLQWFGV